MGDCVWDRGCGQLGGVDNLGCGQLGGTTRSHP